MELSEYLGVEIAGLSYSSNGSGSVTDMVLGKYTNNSNTESYVNQSGLYSKYGANFLTTNLVQDFHTHPDGKLGATESAPHLSTDVKTLHNRKPSMPYATFIVLYRILNQRKPGEYDYTHEYKPKKK